MKRGPPRSPLYPYTALCRAFFGFVGYVLIKSGFEPAPMLLGFVLGKLMEEHLRRALVFSRGSFMTFIESRTSAGSGEHTSELQPRQNFVCRFSLVHKNHFFY